MPISNNHQAPLNPSEAAGDGGYSQPVQREAFSDVDFGSIIIYI
jgi:hypothetical protein